MAWSLNHSTFVIREFVIFLPMPAELNAPQLDAVRTLKQRGAQIALFLVDERMPHMTGTQFWLLHAALVAAATVAMLLAWRLFAHLLAPGGPEPGPDSA